MRMKWLVAAFLGGCLTMQAQSLSLEQALKQIEQNNKSLQATRQQTNALQLGTKIENNLANPEAEYVYLFGRPYDERNESELNLTQSFDFPTLYASRRNYGKLQSRAYESRYSAARCNLLLQAKELCLEMICLQKRKALIDYYTNYVDSLVNLYEKKLEAGDANVIEVNKVKMEYMAVRSQQASNDAEYRKALQELIAMNGNLPIAYDEKEYPVSPLLPRYEEVRDEAFAADYELLSAGQEHEAALKGIQVQKGGWLPKWSVGYRRSGTIGTEFSGFIVGASIPIFENKNKVKQAKAEAKSAELLQQETALQLEAKLQGDYNEAVKLQKALSFYDYSLMGRTLQYLRQSLNEGQISLLTYFTEATPIVQEQMNYVDLECRYQQALARLYKHRL